MPKKKYLLLILIILSIISLFIGAANISWESLSTKTLLILFISRIPRLISILLTGIGMSIAGLIMQQLSQNKFASPSTSGTIESASFGILIAIICFGTASVFAKICIAFIFALLGSWLFMKMLNHVIYKDALFIPLLGIMLGRVIAAITTFIAYRYDLLQSLNAWLYGDFSGVLKGHYELLYLVVPSVLASYYYAHHFTIAGFGEDFSGSLGLNYKKIRYIGLIIVALVTGSIVLTVGEIPFIGLIIPNILTLINGDNIKVNLPYSAILGAFFVLICDIIGRLILYPYEISVSLIIGSTGSIVFLFFLMRQKNYA